LAANDALMMAQEIDTRAASRGDTPREAPLLALALITMLACMAALGWIFWGVSPALNESANGARAALQRVQTLADGLVASELAVGLANGDYGEVQETLNRHQAVGFLSRGVVQNSAGKSVAAVGTVAGLRMGEAMPAALQSAGRAIDVTQGARSIGRLVVLAVPEGANESWGKGTAGLRAALILAATLALMSAGAVIWLWRDLRTRKRASRLRAAAAVQARMKSHDSGRALPPSGGMDEMSRTTLQFMETELRKRLAEARERRGPMTGEVFNPGSTSPGMAATNAKRSETA